MDPDECRQSRGELLVCMVSSYMGCAPKMMALGGPRNLKARERSEDLPWDLRANALAVLVWGTC